MKLSLLYQDLCTALGKTDTPELEARIVLKERTELDWSDVIARPDTEISSDIAQLIDSDVERRLAGEPLSRIYGRREFWGMDFELSSDTLDPRPDTETLVEVALKAYEGIEPPQTILDLGTGTGCILLSLLKEWPTAHGLGVDKAEGAVKTAQQNAKKHNLRDRATFRIGNWGQGIAQKFDLIVSNPPYIANQIITNLAGEVQNHDPILALDGGKDGLECYRQIFSELFSLLNPGGKAFFEIGFDQKSDLMRLAEESRIRISHVHRDLGGQPRVVEISSGDK